MTLIEWWRYDTTKKGIVYCYGSYIGADNEIVGAIRVADKRVTGKSKRISPLFIMQEHRNKETAICMRRWGITRQEKQ